MPRCGATAAPTSATPTPRRRSRPRPAHDANGPLTIATLQFAGLEPERPHQLRQVGAPSGPGHPAERDPQFTQIPVGRAAQRVPAARRRARSTPRRTRRSTSTRRRSCRPTRRPTSAPTSARTPACRVRRRTSSQVLADVTQGPGAYQGGDPNIVALSTSWGTCEDVLPRRLRQRDDHGGRERPEVAHRGRRDGVRGLRRRRDLRLRRLRPGPTKIAVDYPASSPEVVGVGGTRLTAVGPAPPTTARNWTDTAWSARRRETCEGVAARRHRRVRRRRVRPSSPMPAYQSAGIGHQKFTTSTGKKGAFGTQPHRLVPDIADDGDPRIRVRRVDVRPDRRAVCCAHHARPATPAQLRDRRHEPVLTGGRVAVHRHAGRTRRDLRRRRHPRRALLRVRRPSRRVPRRHHRRQRPPARRRPCTPPRATSAEFPVNAQKGYDTLTGLGAPLWPRIAPFIFAPADAAARPVRSALASPHSTHARDDGHRDMGSRAGRQGRHPRGVGIASRSPARATKTPVYHVRLSAGDRGRIPSSPTTAATTCSRSPRATSPERPRATITKTLVVPFDDRSFAFHGTWYADQRADGLRRLARRHRRAEGAIAKATARGRRYVLEVRTGPAYGKLEIDHGSHHDRHATTCTRRRSGTCASCSSARATTPLATRTFTFRYTGTKNPRSTVADGRPRRALRLLAELGA